MSKHEARKVFEKLAADPRFHGRWMTSEAWTILFEKLSVVSYKQNTISRVLTEFCDGSNWKLHSLCIKTHAYSIRREKTENRTTNFYLIYPETKQQDESILNVTGGREQWQKRYDDSLIYCRDIPPCPIIQLQKVANARVEQVNARFREEERKAIAARQEEEEKAIAAQDPWERFLDKARVAWEAKYSEEFPTELFQKMKIDTIQ